MDTWMLSVEAVPLLSHLMSLASLQKSVPTAICVLHVCIFCGKPINVLHFAFAITLSTIVIKTHDLGLYYYIPCFCI